MKFKCIHCNKDCSHIEINRHSECKACRKKLSMRKYKSKMQLIFNEQAVEKYNNDLGYRAKVKASQERLLNRSKYNDFEAIKNVYKICERMNSIFINRSYEVDHIIPITHSLVCGLHVACNLQILSKESNRTKSNKFPYNT